MDARPREPAAAHASTLAQLWPPFGLRLRTERLELRIVTDDDLAALAAVARDGIHPPEEMPFMVPWSVAEPPQLERNVLQFNWRCRATWTPESWKAVFAVVADGRVVGTQGLDGTDFAVRRAVSTGSWLGQAFQGRGIGKEMRTAVLALAFDGLGATMAYSGAYTTNPASASVSLSLGYREAGTEIIAVQDRRMVERRFEMRREDWESKPRPAVEITGLEPCLPMFGAA